MLGWWGSSTHSLLHEVGEFYYKIPFGNHPLIEHNQYYIQNSKLEFRKLYTLLFGIS